MTGEGRDERDGVPPSPVEATPGPAETEQILALIDRLEDLLDRSDLAELEVQAGEFGIVLRKPGQLVVAGEPHVGGVDHEVSARGGEAGRHGGDGRSQADRGSGDREAGGSGRDASDRAAAPGAAGSAAGPGAAGDASDAERIDGHAVIAPLTGIFYSAPSPGAAPYVTAGADVLVGQVIGLIEAMKLFNEIKSDAAGRVVRILAADGALVRAKQPLVEIETS